MTAGYLPRVLASLGSSLPSAVYSQFMPTRRAKQLESCHCSSGEILHCLHQTLTGSTRPSPFVPPEILMLGTGDSGFFLQHRGFGSKKARARPRDCSEEESHCPESGNPNFSQPSWQAVIGPILQVDVELFFGFCVSFIPFICSPPPPPDRVLPRSHA